MDESEQPEPEQVTQGRLDGLVISPVRDEHGVLTFVDFTVDTLPGLRLTLETGAAEELHYVLGLVLGKG